MGQYRVAIYTKWQFGLQIDWGYDHIGFSILCFRIYIGLSKNARGIRFFKYDL